MIMGFVGALIASVALYKGYNAIQAKDLRDPGFLPHAAQLAHHGLALRGPCSVWGTLIGALGSSISLRKFLDV